MLGQARADPRSQSAMAWLTLSLTCGNVPIVVGSFGALYDIRSPVRGAVGFVGRGFLKANNAVIDLTNLIMYLRPPGKGRPANLAGALRSIGMSEVPFTENSEGHFIVDVELNGVPAKMMLDTGAQVSEIDARFAKVANARGWKRDNVFRVDAAGAVTHGDLAGTRALSIGGIPVRAPTVLLGNLAFYNSTGGKVVGVLGLDVIGQNWGIIDFGQKKFYFAKAE